MQKIYRSLAIALGCAAVAILAGCSGGEMGLPPPISVATAPGSATVPAGTTARFSATVAEDANNRGVTWTVTCSAAACGSVSPTTTPSGTATTYTAPSSPPASDLTVTVTATSAADKSKSGSIIVTVPAVAVSVTPDPATVPAATNQQFTATVINTSNTTVSWTLTQGGAACSPDCGTLSSATSNPVTYSAPATPPATDLTLTLMATSAADKTKSYSATIIFPTISVSVSGPTTVAEDTSQQFTATVSNDPANKGGTWTLTQGGAACSPGCGTLSGQTSTSVTYNALGAVPANPTVTVTATSVADTTKSGALDVTLTNPDAALNGHYAFLFNGFDDATGKQVAVAGSMTVDGLGNITDGIEDINEPSGVHTSVTFTGTYIIGLDNRGTASFTNSLGGKITYAFAVGSINDSGVATKARLIEFDDATGTNGTRGSGVMRLQDTSAFSQSSITGPYAFGFVGQNPSGKRRTFAGVFTADGAGNITGGTEDVNDAGTVTNSVSFIGTYTAPSSTNGRATATLTSSGSGSNQSVYVVSASELLVMSTDAISSAGLMSGTELSQASTSFSSSSLNGNPVFYEVGVNSNSLTTQSDVEIGLFSPNGSGELSLTFDKNNGGSITSNSTISGLTYSVASGGRVTIKGGTGSQPILYLVDKNKAFLLDTGGSVAFGFLEPQSGGPFSDSSITGKYFFGVAPPTVGASIVASGVATGQGRFGLAVTPAPNAEWPERALATAARYWLPLALFTALCTLILSSRRRGFWSARILASTALLAVLGLTGCRVVHFLAETQDSSSSNGTLTSGVTGSTKFTVSSNGRATIGTGVIYIISLEKFVLIDESPSDAAPTVQIFER